MPTYEYRCSHCSHEFEESQSIKESPLVNCPQCKQDRLIRVIGAGGGMIFKGSGFYQTDYKGTASSKTNQSSVPHKDVKKEAPASGTTIENKSTDTSSKPRPDRPSDR